MAEYKLPTRTCATCRKKKLLACFGTEKRRKDGTRPECGDCLRSRKTVERRERGQLTRSEALKTVSRPENSPRWKRAA